jgi:hypothetical protein
MKSANLRIALKTTPDELRRLEALQNMFAQACNLLSPLVQQTRCWNRVALHHMAYKQLRERFPELGSQMVCNAIYSVSRTSRVIYQGAGSPFNIAKLGSKPLPLVQFVPHAPVYFDRHTLSLKDGVASLFTLDGRMRFSLDLKPADEKRFRDDKLRAIVLSGSGKKYTLTFEFGSDDDAAAHALAMAQWPAHALISTDAASPAPGHPPSDLPSDLPSQGRLAQTWLKESRLKEPRLKEARPQ